MILVEKIVNSLLDENCYIVYNDQIGQALIIDPGSDFDKITTFIKEKSLNVLAVLLTHGHFDHTFCCKKLQYIGYKIYIHDLDKQMCLNKRDSLAYLSGEDFQDFVPDVYLTSEQNINIGDFDIDILYVPGHSRGGVAYIIENNLFSGDTLFFNGYGRTDFDGGDEKQILSSVKLLLSYTKKGYKLYPGHDY